VPIVLNIGPIQCFDVTAVGLDDVTTGSGKKCGSGGTAPHLGSGSCSFVPMASFMCLVFLSDSFPVILILSQSYNMLDPCVHKAF
jgi:hypothetical protein